MAELGAETVLHRRISGRRGCCVGRWLSRAANSPRAAVARRHAIAPDIASARRRHRALGPPRRSARRRQRSRKSLASVATFGAYPARLVRRACATSVAAGAPFAVVNANCAAGNPARDRHPVRGQPMVGLDRRRQAAIGALPAALLRDHGYPSDAEAYSAQGIAAAFDERRRAGAVGRAAAPDVPPGDRSHRRHAAHLRALGARRPARTCYLYERTHRSALELADRLVGRSARPLGRDARTRAARPAGRRTAALRRAARAATGRTLRRERFAEVMDLVNEQEDYYRRTRDLIAAHHPAPIGDRRYDARDDGAAMASRHRMGARRGARLSTKRSKARRRRRRRLPERALPPDVGRPRAVERHGLLPALGREPRRGVRLVDVPRARRRRLYPPLSTAGAIRCARSPRAS